MQMSLNTPEMWKTVDPFTLVLGICLYEVTRGADIALSQGIGSEATLFWFVLYSDRPAQGQSVHQPSKELEFSRFNGRAETNGYTFL